MLLWSRGLLLRVGHQAQNRAPEIRARAYATKVHQRPLAEVTFGKRTVTLLDQDSEAKTTTARTQFLKELLEATEMPCKVKSWNSDLGMHFVSIMRDGTSKAQWRAVFGPISTHTGIGVLQSYDEFNPQTREMVPTTGPPLHLAGGTVESMAALVNNLVTPHHGYNIVASTLPETIKPTDQQVHKVVLSMGQGGCGEWVGTIMKGVQLSVTDFGGNVYVTKFENHATAQQELQTRAQRILAGDLSTSIVSSSLPNLHIGVDHKLVLVADADANSKNQNDSNIADKVSIRAVGSMVGVFEEHPNQSKQDKNIVIVTEEFQTSEEALSHLINETKRRVVFGSNVLDVDPKEPTLYHSIQSSPFGVNLGVSRVKMTKKNRVWHASVNGNGMVMLSGVAEGKMVKHERTYDVGKGSRTPHQQALSELWSMVRKKTKQGFMLELDALNPVCSDTQQSTEKNSTEVTSIGGIEDADKDVQLPPRPMLSMKYTKSRLAKHDRAFYQPKLDGVRCVADLRTGRLWSRAGTEIVLKHVSVAVKAFGEKTNSHTVCSPDVNENKAALWKVKTDKNLEKIGIENDNLSGKSAKELRWLDGELYCHNWSFQQVTSVVRRTKNNASDEVAKNVSLHVFDIVMDAPFRERWDYFENAIAGKTKPVFAEDNNTHPFPIIAVDTVEVELADTNMADIAKMHVKHGYEGTMWRPDNETYYQQDKRSASSLKYKSFEQTEFACIGIEKGKYSDMAGSFVLRLADGRTFNATPKVPKKERVEIWENREMYTNNDLFVATVQHQGVSDDGVPRFPVMVGFRHRDDTGHPEE